jgi:hypothetical protein
MFNCTLFQLKLGDHGVPFCGAKGRVGRSLIFNSVSWTKQEYRMGEV